MKNTKKAYIVPDVQFEEFELTVKIAGSCGDPWIDNIKEAGGFNDVTEGCDFNYSDYTGDGYDGACYHTVDIILQS